MIITQRKIVSLAVGFGAFFLVAGSVTWVLYAVYMQRSDAKVVRWFAGVLPAARVGSRTIPYAKFLEVRDTMRVYLTSDAGKSAGGATSITPILEKNILDRLERDAAMKEMADARNTIVTDEQVTEAFNQLIASTSSTPKDIDTYLADTYHWTKSDFELNVIRPSLLETAVAKTFSTTSSVDAYSAFDAAMKDRISKPDVKTYLRFSDIEPTPAN